MSITIEGFPTVRLNFQCVSVRDIQVDEESIACGDQFFEGLVNAVHEYNRSHQSEYEDSNPSGEWFKTLYYTCEDTGYYFYEEPQLNSYGQQVQFVYQTTGVTKVATPAKYNEVIGRVFNISSPHTEGLTALENKYIELRNGETKPVEYLHEFGDYFVKEGVNEDG